eukprot:evm.model.scf_2236.2 EVM.evm.TU.scf_2236.2   scf_2236:17277-25177(-)
MSKARVMYGNAVKKVEALEVDKHTLKLKVVELEEELKEAVCSKDAMEFTAQRLSKQVAALTLQFENSKNNGALLSSSVASDATSVADLVEQNRELMTASEEARRLQADVSERVEFAVMKAKIEADHKIKGLQGALRKAEADCEHMGHQCRLYREALEKGSPARDEGPVERSTKLEHDAGIVSLRASLSRGQKRPRGEPLSGDEGGPWEEREEIGAGAGDQEPKSANLSAKRDGQEQEEEDATGAQAQTAEGTPDRGPKRPKRRIVWRGRGR